MALSASSPRLCEQDALRLVQTAFRGVKGVVASFECSYGAVDHKLSCDAMSFTSDYLVSSIDENPDECVRRGAAHREAVELCFAVSCCAGFGFHENREFWLKALSLDRDGTAILAIGDIECVFPRLVFKWNGQFLRSDGLPDHLRGFFGLPSAVATTQSDSFRVSMDLLAAYMLRERKKNAIHVTLDIVRVIKRGMVIPRVSALVTEVTSSLKTASSADGIRLVLDSTRFNEQQWSYGQLQSLMEQLPAEVGIKLMLNYTSELDRSLPASPAERSHALQLMVGVSGTEWTGRLRELDVSGGFHNCLWALCSLLPFSLSLETLTVSATRHTDFVWLGYAMFHPRAHQTRWKTIHLYAHKAKDRVDYGCLELCAKVGAWTLALSSSASGVHCKRRLEQASADGEIFSTKFATIRSYTGVLRLRGFDRQQRVSLSQGLRVEMCDASWATSAETSPRYVDVIVTGYGVGRIRTESLEMSESSVSTATATSCISKLTLSELSSANTSRLAWLLTPGLDHLSVRVILSHDWADERRCKLAADCEVDQGLLVYERLRGH